MESVERFGLLVEVLPGKTGLVHQSELDVDRGVAPEAFSTAREHAVFLGHEAPEERNGL